MASHYYSNKVRVFPSTNRYIYPQGKLTSENNFVNIINSITDYKDYVLDYANGVFKVIIHGYYFEVETSIIANLYFSILIETTEYGQLVSWNSDGQLDSSGNFCGLATSINAPPQWPDWIDQAHHNTKYRMYSLNVTDGTSKLINKWRFTTDASYFKGLRTLTDDLDKRQYKLKAGSGIADISNNFGDNTVRINDTEMTKLNGLVNKGSKTTFVYFDNNGVAQPSDATVGGKSNKNGVISTADIYLNGGTLTKGRTVYASTSDPSNTVGEVGDIWLKYQG